MKGFYNTKTPIWSVEGFLLSYLSKWKASTTRQDCSAHLNRWLSYLSKWKASTTRKWDRSWRRAKLSYLSKWKASTTLTPWPETTLSQGCHTSPNERLLQLSEAELSDWGVKLSYLSKWKASTTVDVRSGRTNLTVVIPLQMKGFYNTTDAWCG